MIRLKMAPPCALLLLLPLVSFAQVTSLNFRPVAAEYNTPLDSIVMIAGSPNQLHLYSVATQSDQTVPLSAAPLSLAVSPDGTHAAVGHAASISYVNLTTKAVEKTFPTAVSPSAITMSNTWIYVFTNVYSSQYSALSVSIATGATVSFSLFTPGTAPRFNPATNSIYGTTDTQYPGTLVEYDVSTGPITNRSEKYPDDYCVEGPVWFSPDGSRIYTGCAVAFRASLDSTVDMAYLASIPPAGSPHFRSFTESAALHNAAGIQGSASVAIDPSSFTDSVVYVFDSNYLIPIAQFALADFSSGTRTFKAHGKWVFYNAKSTALFAVVEADSTSGLINDFAIQTLAIPPSSCTASVATLTASVVADGETASVAINAPATCTYQASSDSPWLQIVSGGYGSGNGALTYIARANATGASRSATVTVGGSAITISQPSQGPAQLTRLPYNVVSAVYDRPMDNLLLTSSSPNELHLFDPATRIEQIVPLPKPPLSISVSPDGTIAAIGHDGWVSLIDLQHKQVLKIVQIAAPVGAVVVDGNGYVYAFSNVYNSSSNAIYAINSVNGSVSSPVRNSFGSVAAVLSPSGDALYSTDSGGLSKWLIQGGVVTPYSYSNSVNGCGNFWPTDDGVRLITACADVYRLSSILTDDLQPNGSLAPLSQIRWADHSAKQQLLAVIPSPSAFDQGTSILQFYQDAFLNFAGIVSLPAFSVAGSSYRGYGQFVFWNSDQTKLITVEQMDKSANLLSNFGVNIVSPSTAGQVAFSTQAKGGAILTTSGSAAAVTVGSVVIQPAAGSLSPAGLAIFDSRQDGVLVSEATVPAVTPVNAGTIYAEVGDSLNTGIALANPNSSVATVSYYFTDHSGAQYGSGSTTIPANGQIAAFLNQSPFNSGDSLVGTFSFTSTVPIGAIALRQRLNQRGESIWTTLPVLPSYAYSNAVFPSFADGGGWATEFVLINMENFTITGTLRFFPPAAGPISSPVNVTINGQSGNQFPYSIPPNSSVKLQTSGTGSAIQVGYAAIVADTASYPPSGLAVFSESNADGIVLSEAGVSATAANGSALLYAESSTDASRIQTGVALANPTDFPMSATLTVTTLGGQTLGTSAAVSIPAHQQVQMFLNQVPGLQNLPPFQGTLAVSSGYPGPAVIGLRSRYNERGEFLITTTAPVGANPGASATFMFPHFADGGGFTTQFILLPQGQAVAGELQFYNQAGKPVSPAIHQP